MAKVERNILTRKDATVLGEVNVIETYLFFLRENKNANEIFCKANVMHELLAKNLW